MVNYAERLCELRTEKGISQKDAARDLNISERTLYRKIKEYNLE